MPLQDAAQSCPARSVSRTKLPRDAAIASTRAVDETTATAWASIVEDDDAIIDPKLYAAATRFIRCDGIAALHDLLINGPRMKIADDARKSKRIVPRRAWPLIRFLSLHIASQQTALGAAVGRRIEWTRKMQKSAVSRPPSTPMFSPGTHLTRRTRPAWRASPMILRLITKHVPPAPTSTLVGGRYLGDGKDRTRVYTFDDLPLEHPAMRALCLHEFPDPANINPHPLCASADNAVRVIERLVRSSGVSPSTLAGLAIKDIPDDQDVANEISYHSRIHRWFLSVDRLILTSLHPTLHFVEINESEPAGTKTRLLLGRLMDGDINRLVLSEHELYDVAEAVLEFLLVMHDHSFLHMDIKPENILYQHTGGGVSRSRFSFALSDYNLIISTATVGEYMRPTGAGSFQSMSHGTRGFISPLTYEDDTQNMAFHRFEYVAKASRAFSSGQQPLPYGRWQDYFQGARDSPYPVEKVDIHSLALTLYEMWRKGGADKKLMQGAFGKFLSKLMFFRPRDAKNAKEALVHLRATRKTRVTA